MPNHRSPLVVAAITLILSACKVSVEVPVGGSVSSASGAYDCPEDSVCVIEVVDLFFDETFTAVPADGYVFTAWKKRERGFYGAKTNPSVRLYTTGLTFLEDFLEQDEVYYLEPTFRKISGPSSDLFTIDASGTTLTMNGEIQSNTLDEFNEFLASYPNIELINMGDVPGSNDDEVNFQVGQVLRENGINTHLLDNAEVASGGVDFFLAGVQRTRGNNTRLGVHSWSDGDGNEATDFPNSSSEHDANIEYHEDLGYSEQWAVDFYFFTINAAPAEDIHWMTEEEIDRFDIFN